MRKHYGGDVIVVQLGLGLVVEDPVGQSSSGRDGHWGQLPLANDVTDGVDLGGRGVGVGIDRDVAPGVCIHAPVLEL